jgi:hypothetical protein
MSLITNDRVSVGAATILCPTYFGFAVDATGSITAAGYNQAWTSIKTAIASAPVAGPDVRFAGLNFGVYTATRPCRSTSVISVWSDKTAALSSTIPTFPSLSNGCLGCGISEPLTLFYNASVIADPAARKVLYISSDGQSNPVNSCNSAVNPPALASAARAQGITVFTVGE